MRIAAFTCVVCLTVFVGGAHGFGTGLTTIAKVEDDHLIGSVLSTFDGEARIHQKMTRKSLEEISVTIEKRPQSFSEPAILEIEDANADADRDVHDPIEHFDDEKLKEGSERIFSLTEEIIASLTGAAPNGSQARRKLGLALHAIQDFYSHSTWLEHHSSSDLAPLGTRDAHPSLTQTLLAQCNGSGSASINSNLTSGYFDHARTLVASPIESVLNFVFPIRISLAPKFVGPLQKCIHGLPAPGAIGINRDLPGRSGHSDAYTAAKAATDEYLRSKVLADPRLRGDVDALCALLDVPPEQCKSGVLEIITFTAPPTTPALPGHGSEGSTSGEAAPASLPLDLGTLHRTDLSVVMCKIESRWLPKKITADRPRHAAEECGSSASNTGHEYTSVSLNTDGTVTGSWRLRTDNAGQCIFGTSQDPTPVSGFHDASIQYTVSLINGAGDATREIFTNRTIGGSAHNTHSQHEGRWGPGVVFFHHVKATRDFRVGDEIPVECKTSITQM